jgi:G:T/U-mismatch repair DNA glycosylase
MGNFKTEIIVDGVKHTTLADILPIKGKLDILFIAKTPIHKSVNAGHYFQGRQGTMFWNKLAEYDILNIPFGNNPDEYLLKNKYGITDIVKIPRSYGNEPSYEEYKNGLERILNLIEKYNPKVIVFVYKKVLDKILELGLSIYKKSKYGFNPDLDKYFNSQVFVFPMPGTPCTRETAIQSMTKLRKLITGK